MTHSELQTDINTLLEVQNSPIRVTPTSKWWLAYFRVCEHYNMSPVFMLSSEIHRPGNANGTFYYSYTTLALPDIGIKPRKLAFKGDFILDRVCIEKKEYNNKPSVAVKLPLKYEIQETDEQRENQKTLVLISTKLNAFIMNVRENKRLTGFNKTKDIQIGLTTKYSENHKTMPNEDLEHPIVWPSFKILAPLRIEKKSGRPFDINVKLYERDPVANLETSEWEYKPIQINAHEDLGTYFTKRSLATIMLDWENLFAMSGNIISKPNYSEIYISTNKESTRHEMSKKMTPQEVEQLRKLKESTQPVAQVSMPGMSQEISKLVETFSTTGVQGVDVAKLQQMMGGFSVVLDKPDTSAMKEESDESDNE